MKVFIILFLTAIAVVQGVTIYSNNFNSGYSGCVTTGTASLVTSPRIGTSGNSVKLPLRSTVSCAVSTVGYSSISLTVNLAASSLESGTDYCVAEYSLNKGASYIPILRLIDGQDTSTWFNFNLNLPSTAENNAVFMVRYRTGGDASGDNCYGEDITVTGTSNSFPPAPPPVMQTTYDTLSGSGAVTRTLLTYTQLTSGSQISGPVDNSAFVVPATAAHPTNYFQGPLETIDQDTVGSRSVVVDLYNYLSAPERDNMPKLYFDYLSHGSHFIPVLRSYQLPSHPFWEFISGPGRVWNENSDNGYSRVSIPFTITQKNSNCVHNGAMTFLFKNAANGVDISLISKGYYQITQETCQYFKANFWGTLTISAVTATISSASTVRSNYEAEVANRLPVKDISQLAVDFPGTNYALIGSEQTTGHMTAFGVEVDGTLYRGGFQTRFGIYPFKDVLVLPSYSTYKSYGTELAALRIQQKYPGTDIFNNFISNRVPSCPTSKWSDVKISHCLDMGTGNYGLAGYESDEGSVAMTNDYFLRETQLEKLSFACNKYARKATPGTFWVYHTPDNYLAGVALRQAISVLEPATGTLDNFLTNDVFIPLKLNPLTYHNKVTYDAVSQEFMAYGNYQTLDDMAKIGRLFNSQEGKINAVQTLDYARLKRALQRDGANPGLTINIPGSSYSNRYGQAFWAVSGVYNGLYDSQMANCGGTYESYMSGFGGIAIVPLKSKLNYMFVSDDSIYSMDITMRELALHVRQPCLTTYSP